jgi:ribonuclease P protein component
VRFPSLKTADFGRVMKDGRKRGNGNMLLVFLPSEPGHGQRLGLIVTNKNGTAIQVNRLKRVLREAFAQEHTHLPDDCDVVLMARPGLKALDADGGMAAVANELRTLILKHKKTHR